MSDERARAQEAKKVGQYFEGEVLCETPGKFIVWCSPKFRWTLGFDSMERGSFASLV